MATDSGIVVYNGITGHLSYGNNNADAACVDELCIRTVINYLFLDSERRLFIEQWIKTNRFPFLHVYDVNTGEKKRFDLQKEQGLGCHQFKGFLQQQNGRVWIYGLPFLSEYENSSNPLHFLKKDYNKEKEPKFNIVYSVFEDRQRNLWICSGYGLYLFNPDAQLFHNYTLTTPKRFTVEGRAQCALQMPNSEGWLGYRDLGPFRYTSQMSPYNLWSNNPRDIIQYNDCLLVVACGALNILNVNTGAIRQSSHYNGLPSNTVEALAKDAFGMLWLGTLNGLCRADLAKLSFAVYDQRDGLLNEGFNIAGARQLNDGRLVFTSAESFLLFNPGSMARKDTYNKAVITDFKLMNTSLRVDSLLAQKQINLNYNNTNLVIEFSALNYSKLSKPDYYYQLQNFDTAWVWPVNQGEKTSWWTLSLPGQKSL